MGKTFRNNDHWCRHPKGRKAALIRGDRNVPPDPYDDIPNSHKNTETRAAKALAGRGLTTEEIAQHLITRAKRARKSLSYKEATELALNAQHHIEYLNQRTVKHRDPNYAEKRQEERERIIAEAEKILKHVKDREKALMLQNRPEHLARMHNWACDKINEICGYHHAIAAQYRDMVWDIGRINSI